MTDYVALSDLSNGTHPMGVLRYHPFFNVAEGLREEGDDTQAAIMESKVINLAYITPDFGEYQDQASGSLRLIKGGLFELQGILQLEVMHELASTVFHEAVSFVEIGDMYIASQFLDNASYARDCSFAVQTLLTPAPPVHEINEEVIYF